MQRVFRGKRVIINVMNPQHVTSGVRQLLVNGRVLQGNLLPVEQLTDGLRVEAVMGPAAADEAAREALLTAPWEGLP